MLLSLIVCWAAGLNFGAASVPRHEAIHSSSRTFTADEFRDFLRVRRFEQTLERLAESSLSDEQRRRLADFAERLVDQSQSPGEKKELKIPEEILKNPAIAEMLRDEEAIERLLQNKPLMDLAERIARNYKLPSGGGGLAERPPAGLAPQGRERTPAEHPGPAAGPRQARPPRAAASAPEKKPSPPIREPEPPPAGAAARAPGENTGPAGGAGAPDRDPALPQQSPTVGRATAEGDQGLDGGNASSRRAGTFEGGGSPSMLRRWAENAQRLGPLQNSKALEAFERRLDQGVGVELPLPSGPAASGFMESLRWPELPSGGAISGVLDRFGDSSMKGVSLPSGLAHWAPSLARLPIPPLPAPSMTLMTPPAPRMPTWSASPLSARGAGAFAGLLALLAAAALLGGWVRTKYGASWRLGFARSPSSSAIQRPDAPLDASSRSSIRAWFEYLVLRCLGESARPKNHRVLVELLRGEASDDARSAADLAGLYEQARYLPPEEPLEPGAPSH